jgi:hypothetical protein
VVEVFESGVTVLFARSSHPIIGIRAAEIDREGLTFKILFPKKQFQLLPFRLAGDVIPVKSIGPLKFLRTVCRVVGGDAMNPTSTLKIHSPDTSLIEKIKDEIKKSAEAKARRMMLKVPKRLAKR